MRHAYYIKSGTVEVHGVQFANSFFRLVIQYWIYLKTGRPMISYFNAAITYIKNDEIISTNLEIIDSRVGTLT